MIDGPGIALLVVFALVVGTYWLRMIFREARGDDDGFAQRLRAWTETTSSEPRRLPRGQCPNCGRDVALRRGRPVPHHCPGPRPAPPPAPPPQRDPGQPPRGGTGVVTLQTGRVYTEAEVERLKRAWEAATGTSVLPAPPAAPAGPERAIYLREREKPEENN